MRRVKMLEYALRQERSKYLSTSTSGLPGAPAGIAKNPLLQGLEKSASGSGRSSPSRNEDMREYRFRFRFTSVYFLVYTH